jgi:hypothetical protein
VSAIKIDNILTYCYCDYRDPLKGKCGDGTYETMAKNAGLSFIWLGRIHEQTLEYGSEDRVLVHAVPRARSLSKLLKVSN